MIFGFNNIIRFPTHKSILLARCPYFKDLLLAAGSLATELIVRLATPGVDTSMFSSLLKFLYTGEYPSQEMSPKQIDLLISLGRECGVPNLLEADLEHLHQSGESEINYFLYLVSNQCSSRINCIS